MVVFAISTMLLISTGAFGFQDPDKKQDKKSNTQKKQDEQDEGFTLRTTNVRLPISVTNEETRRFVTDLLQNDFRIFEDKVQQNILEFKTQMDLPLDVAIIMDTSNSVKPKLKFEKEAAASFLETMLSSRKDRALFVTFDSEVKLHQDFTNRLDLLTQSINKVKAQGNTRLYDAVYQVCEEKMASQIGRRRAMIIISDGDDTESDHTLEQAIDMAQRTETVIFAINTKAGGFFGVKAGMVDGKEDKHLKRLAEDTGGRTFVTSEVIELEKSFTKIAQELRSQYVLVYQPSNEKFDGKYRTIDVKIPGKKDLKIRAKKGYSAMVVRASGQRSP